MKIKDWSHAIKLTIERHQAVLDGKYENYGIAGSSMQESDWMDVCPLCEYLHRRGNKSICKSCLWVKYTGEECINSTQYDYWDDKEGIERLSEWLELEKNK